jgi:prepilin-type N-terminal cleavage/methylation domain-containing protein
MRTSRSTGLRAGRLRLASRAAFTLVELLIVISIFVLLLAIAVPAFSSMLYSMEQASADNALRIGVAAARDAAIRAGAGRDGAAVFVIEEERLTIVPCVKAGIVDDVDAAGNPVAREVFAPITGFEPVKLPRTWTVRGYATAGMITDDWYETTYTDTALRAEANWVLPETDAAVFDEDATTGDEGAKRQTFLIRFEGGTGMLKPDPTGVLVLLPVEFTEFRYGGSAWADWRGDQEPDGARFVARVLAAPVGTGAGQLSQVERRELLGDEATDTVLARGVSQVALCNEKALASALGLTPDRNTGTLYTGYTEPRFVPGLDGSVAMIENVSKWLEGRLTNAAGSPIPSEARVFTIQRYTGALQEVTGTAFGQGVTQ